MFSGSSMIALAAVNVIRKDPGFIVGPISKLLGWLLNLVFNVVYTISPNNALGFSIIALTVLVRCCMIPLAFKQQKSMFIMQKIQPDIKKIQDKYKERASSDPEIQKKMNMEMQKLYSKHGYNPFSGCLPMIIQLPIFIALYYILQNPYQFIESLKNMYTELGYAIINAKSFGSYESFSDFISSVPDIGAMIPKSMGDIIIDGSEEGMANLGKLMSKFSESQWDFIRGVVPSIEELYQNKFNAEYFYGINLTERVGLSFPKVLIPIASGVTTFFSGWLMTRRNKAADAAMASQQRVMNIAMPLFMAYITSTIPGGVGVYWITSNLFQICQQIFINKHYEKKMSKEKEASK